MLKTGCPCWFCTTVDEFVQRDCSKTQRDSKAQTFVLARCSDPHSFSLLENILMLTVSSKSSHETSTNHGNKQRNTRWKHRKKQQKHEDTKTCPAPQAASCQVDWQLKRTAFNARAVLFVLLIALGGSNRKEQDIETLVLWAKAGARHSSGQREGSYCGPANFGTKHLNKISSVKCFCPGTIETHGK